ncbi:MAG: 3-phosphoshikimate 1-carboxyvinyltransferase [Oligoflexales bacterium]|nr:3-phosphoshikimate 1-carboxyvinyltransferase [Oligoflexales bacterium]
MQLDNELAIPLLDRPLAAKIRIPGSKSLTNRALCLAALAKGQSTLEGVLHSNDTKRMIEAWRKLGVDISEPAQNKLIINGCGGVIPPCTEDLYCENAGTAMRFLTAILCLGKGPYRLTGNNRMYERPIRDLIRPLTDIGCKVLDERGSGCPPLTVAGGGFPGGDIELEGSNSSQYLSAIMITAPYAFKQTTRLTIKGSLVSRTYVDMTIKIMQDFGVEAHWISDNCLEILPKKSYQSQNYQIEGDASSASYFFVGAAISQGKVSIEGLSKNSTQGDLGLVEILEKMGCEVVWGQNSVTLKGKPLKAITVDMNTMSDVALSLAIAALFAEGKTTINNVANMRIKECDRISAICKELKKFGAVVEEWEDGFSVQGSSPLHGAKVDTYDDHRMAMSLALVGLNVPGVVVNEPSCVSKTFPNYFDVLFSAIGKND